jgi:DNA-binding transcriptional regulator LsrR (DeoR family)
MAQVDELRLISKVARLYYDYGQRQGEIADQLGLSQATVSRLLNRARDAGIVRITVNVPNGVNTEQEEALVARYKLKDAIVVDCEDEGDEGLLMRQIGSAGAYYVESMLHSHDVVGISSWSSSLLALVDAMHPISGRTGIQVVQILGGIGNPTAEVHANRLTSRFANLVSGEAYFLPAPGIVGSQAALKVILSDPYVSQTLALFEKVTIALVGIGDVAPSRLLTMSGNVLSEEDQDLLKSKGAVGDILLRYFDSTGKPVKGPLSDRVVSMSLEQLRMVERAIAVAGGERKHQAILAALRGGWINILITDHCTAGYLINA